MVMGLLDVAPSAVAAKYKGINLVAISFLLFLVLNFNAAVRNNNPHDFIKTKLFSYKLNELPNQQYHDPIWTEALLTLRRITNQIDSEPNLFFLWGLFEYGRDKFLPRREYGRMIDVLMLILNHFEAFRWGNAVHEWTYEIICRTLFWMTICFRHTRPLPQNNPYRQELFANVIKGLGCASTFAAKIKISFGNNLLRLNTTKIDKVNGYIINAVSPLSKMLREVNEEDCQQLKHWLYRYNHFDYTEGNSKQSLLHWTSWLSNIPMDLVRLLLELKAHHNALDCKGQTPLHIVAINWKSRANVAEVAELPMNAGCHLNQPDINGVTSLQLFRQMHDRLTAEGLLDTAPNLEELIHPVVLPLTCYCAKLFVSTNFLSNNLFRPLSSHSSKNMANCHEVGAHAEQIFQIAFIVVLKKIHVLLLCFRAYTEGVE